MRLGVREEGWHSDIQGGLQLRISRLTSRLRGLMLTRKSSELYDQSLSTTRPARKATIGFDCRVSQHRHDL